MRKPKIRIIPAEHMLNIIDKKNNLKKEIYTDNIHISPFKNNLVEVQYTPF